MKTHVKQCQPGQTLDKPKIVKFHFIKQANFPFNLGNDSLEISSSVVKSVKYGDRLFKLNGSNVWDVSRPDFEEMFANVKLGTVCSFQVVKNGFSHLMLDPMSKVLIISIYVQLFSLLCSIFSQWSPPPPGILLNLYMQGCCR